MLRKVALRQLSLANFLRSLGLAAWALPLRPHVAAAGERRKAVK